MNVLNEVNQSIKGMKYHANTCMLILYSLSHIKSKEDFDNLLDTHIGWENGDIKTFVEFILRHPDIIYNIKSHIHNLSLNITYELHSRAMFKKNGTPEYLKKFLDEVDSPVKNVKISDYILWMNNINAILYTTENSETYIEMKTFHDYAVYNNILNFSALICPLGVYNHNEISYRYVFFKKDNYRLAFSTRKIYKGISLRVIGVSSTMSAVDKLLKNSSAIRGRYKLMKNKIINQDKIISNLFSHKSELSIIQGLNENNRKDESW